MKTLVKFDGVSKRYCRTIKTSMKYGVKDIFLDLLGRNDTSILRADEFWGVDSVSFEVARGECLGVIGANGAGKSTLLKLLSGLYAPDKGSIQTLGSIGALLEVGAGFHPLLTGKENIYLNGSILGMSEKQIRQKFDKIVQFSGLEDYLDMPVKNYSSGMYVRLGFAVASQINPEILVVDEALAVGDVSFRARCLNYFKEYLQAERGCLVFVSHNRHDIHRVADRVLYLEQGVASLYDSAGEALNYHDQRMLEKNQQAISSASSFELRSLNFAQEAVSVGSDFSVIVEFETARQFDDLQVGYMIQTAEGVMLLADSHTFAKTVAGRYTVTLSWENIAWAGGTYWFGLFVWANNRTENLLSAANLKCFSVSDPHLDTLKRDGLLVNPAVVDVQETPRI